jgi:hypothetical protein
MMWIRFRIQLINFEADPDFYLMLMRIRIRILATKMMRIHGDPDPQHCSKVKTKKGYLTFHFRPGAAGSPLRSGGVAAVGAAAAPTQVPHSLLLQQ